MTNAEVDKVVSEIEQLDLDGLRRFWGQRYGAPPALRSVPILRMLLAWRVQSDAFGGLDGESRRTLGRKGRVRAEGLDLGIGARLTRQWQGKIHEVLVEVGGFRWQGSSYRSLSAVATAIAGSKWNGPRFFGLREAS